MTNKSLLVLTAELFGATLELKPSAKGYPSEYWYSCPEQYEVGAGSPSADEAAYWYLKKVDYPKKNLAALYRGRSR